MSGLCGHGPQRALGRRTRGACGEDSHEPPEARSIALAGNKGQVAVDPNVHWGDGPVVLVVKTKNLPSIQHLGIAS